MPRKSTGEYPPNWKQIAAQVKADAGELYPMHRVGKQRAGRLLDGQTWNEFPKPRRTQEQFEATQGRLF